MNIRQSKAKSAFWGLVVTAALLFSAPPAWSGPLKDGLWPVSTPEAQGVDSRKLIELVEHIQDRSIHLGSLLVIRHGHLIMDAYFQPFPKNRKHIIHSCTKSITSTLLGIALDKGLLKSIDQPVLSFFPELQPDNMTDSKKAMTVRNLLMMASGLTCRDSYRYNWAGLIKMRRSPDWVDYVLSLPMAEPPGQRFEYCNGVSHLLSAILQKATGVRTSEFARQYLFGPLGITDFQWPISPAGVDVGYGRVRMLPHDMAKLGWLFLKKGLWGDQRLISSQWVTQATSPLIQASHGRSYGFQWWVHPNGHYVYAAVGYRGQRIYVIPDRDMVVVMTADLSPRATLLPDRLVETFVVPAAVADSPLPPAPEADQRLKSLVAEVSKLPAQGFIWRTKAEGVAKDYRFKRTAPPAFSFGYPPGARKSRLIFPFQLMRMTAPGGLDLIASVMDIPQGMALKDFGTVFYAGQLKKLGDRVRVTYQAKVTLNNGAEAWRTEFRWRLKGKMPLVSRVVAVYKGGKCVFLETHSARDNLYFETMIDSFRFD